MYSLRKITIISAVLLAPVLVFLFLKNFGSNKFELPVYYTNGLTLAACEADSVPHIVDANFIQDNAIKLPALLTFSLPSVNEFDSDLINVLAKYPEVNQYIISSTSQVGNTAVVIDSLSYIQLLNCELVLGEDRFLTEAIDFKYVLIDSRGRIRGYYLVNELEEIERIDIELDILLNYDNESY